MSLQLELHAFRPVSRQIIHLRACKLFAPGLRRDFMAQIESVTNFRMRRVLLRFCGEESGRLSLQSTTDTYTGRWSANTGRPRGVDDHRAARILCLSPLVPCCRLLKLHSYYYHVITHTKCPGSTLTKWKYFKRRYYSAVREKA